MINLTLGKFNINLHFSFFAAVSLLILLNRSELAVLGLYACLIHECGHVFAMLLTGQKAGRITFYGAGIKIVKASRDIQTPFSSDIFVLISGVLLNIVIFAITLPLDGEAKIFGAINLLIALFNLLPLSCLDGGKILVALFLKLCAYERAVRLEKYLHGLSIALSVIILTLFAAFGFWNFTFYLTVAYLLFSELALNNE